MIPRFIADFPLPIAEWYDLRSLANPVNSFLDWLKDIFPDWVAYIVSGLIGAAAIGLFLGVVMLLLIWVERRVVARIHIRQGPNRVGPQGILQPVADAIKLMQKEALTPREGDRILFWLAPLLLFIPTVLVTGVIPFGEGMSVADLNVGVLFIIAVTSAMPLVVFSAGWSSSNKYSTLGAMRVMALVISYELPAVIALLSLVTLTGTLQLGEIVQWQADHWMIAGILLPLPFLIYTISTLAEVGRSPADVTEAESELGSGYLTEYSGMRWGLFYAAELANALIFGGLIATFFWGGWWFFGLENIIPGWIIFMVKMLLGYWIFVWARGTLPRLRIDQLLQFSWKFLIPIALINAALVAVEVVAWQEWDIANIIAIPLMIVINAVMAIVLIVGLVRLFGFSRIQQPRRAILTTEVGILGRTPEPNPPAPFPRREGGELSGVG
jgi:NADH-quinone oxidoreductase subunit H